MTRVRAGPRREAPMSDELDLAQSVAGEEDPGASVVPGAASAPGCPNCGGSGRSANRTCPVCQGTGKVAAGTGGT